MELRPKRRTADGSYDRKELACARPSQSLPQATSGRSPGTASRDSSAAAPPARSRGGTFVVSISRAFVLGFVGAVYLGVVAGRAL